MPSGCSLPLFRPAACLRPRPVSKWPCRRSAATFEPWWELIAAFQRSHPLVRVSVFTTERRVELVEDGIDVALRVGEVVHEAMVGRRLLSYSHVLVASPQLLARFGDLTSPEGWHTHEHLPERLSIPGFRRGTRWIATDGGPRYMVLYEVESLATLASEAYLARLNNPTPWTMKMMLQENAPRTACPSLGARVRTFAKSEVGSVQNEPARQAARASGFAWDCHCASSSAQRVCA